MDSSDYMNYGEDSANTDRYRSPRTALSLMVALAHSKSKQLSQMVLKYNGLHFAIILYNKAAPEGHAISNEQPVNI